MNTSLLPTRNIGNIFHADAVLNISPIATQREIRNAYKRLRVTFSPLPIILTDSSAALLSHPDRIPYESPERAECTRKFQVINDAYYTLCDEKRRSEYDFAYNSYFGNRSESSTKPTAFDSERERTNANNDFPWSSFGFSTKAKTDEEKTRFQSDQFGDVFEEILKEEGIPEQNTAKTGRFWGLLGGFSGATMGFIIANLPGMLVGAFAGNKLGSFRDTKGKSVYEGKVKICYHIKY